MDFSLNSKTKVCLPYNLVFCCEFFKNGKNLKSVKQNNETAEARTYAHKSTLFCAAKGVRESKTYV